MPVHVIGHPSDQTPITWQIKAHGEQIMIIFCYCVCAIYC